MILIWTSAKIAQQFAIVAYVGQRRYKQNPNMQALTVLYLKTTLTRPHKLDVMHWLVMAKAAKLIAPESKVATP